MSEYQLRNDLVRYARSCMRVGIAAVVRAISA